MRVSLLILICFSVLTGFAQDPQFSQYYSAPLLLNPAFTGAGECYRAGVNGRTQWSGLERAYNTSAAFVDLNYEDLRSGFGVMVMHDKMGLSKLSTSEFSGFYSYLAPFTSQFNIRFGLQGSYVSRSINYNRLVFEDQYSGTQVSDDFTSDPVAEKVRTNYFDASAGMVIFGEDKYWLGISAHHITQPYLGFYSDVSRLPVKYSIHGGINFYSSKKTIKNQEPLRIVPTFLYKAQAKFDQADVGVYFIQQSFLFGAWYRGIFFKEDERIRNNDAIIVQAGIKLDNFSFVYSYDYTISHLLITNTNGSHEVSVVYNFCLEWPRKRKPNRNVRRLPCPDFQKSNR